MQKVYINGAGLITASGKTITQNLAAMRANNCVPSTVNINQGEHNLALKYFVCDSPLNDVNRHFAMIDAVVEQAFNDANLSKENISKLGLFVGSTSFDMPSCEAAIKASDLSTASIDTHVPPFNRLTHHIQQRFGIKGCVFTFNTACTASANALMYGAEFIRQGDISHALVLGLEFFNEVTALGFTSLNLISQTTMSPFSAQRDGLFLGEGCGAVILSLDKNNAKCAYIAGANIGDNYSITASNPNGDVPAQVMRRAMHNAQVSPSEINQVKCHGTASLSNDESEAQGLRQVFNGDCPPIITLKPFIGHTLGACGINELILLSESIARKKLLSHHSHIDPEFDLTTACDDDYQAKSYSLLNYFGFGGNSTSLVISHEHE